MITLAEIAAGLRKTTLGSKRAALDRLNGHGWVVREGIPDAASLPDEKKQVWLFIDGISNDQDNQSFNSEAFLTRWRITWLTQESATDQYETSLDELIEAAAIILESFTDAQTGMSLDGYVDYIENFNIVPDVGLTAAGDKNIVGFVLTFDAHHPLEPVRCP